MTWSQEIAGAYRLGLADGKAGRKPRQDLEFAGAYAQGHLHGEAGRRNRQPLTLSQEAQEILGVDLYNRLRTL